MNIYIAHKDIPINNKKSLFMLTRPFFTETDWCKSGVDIENITSIKKVAYTFDIQNADIVLLPFSINFYFNTKKNELLEQINEVCKTLKINAFGYISGDFGIVFPEFSNIIYFRQGGFKSQLSTKNKGFIVGLSDHFQRLYQKETIIPSFKKDLPTIGFCGHASLSFSKKIKENFKCLLENGKRFFKNPFNNVYEPLFASAFERAKLLKILENSNEVKTNFIYRKHYRGGAISIEKRTSTTLEYYNNIIESDYILCVRGAGNFSVRLYETLMMGKTPVFVNTDCLLPFEDKIDWKKHVVWIEWKDRKKIAQKVAHFHTTLSDNEFVHLQISNRKLWKETLSVNGILEMISNDI